MNYRHSYHAGNFADVFKHTVLALVIDALCKKEKPFCYIDTHAGRGQYDLMSHAAQKTQEFTEGIARVWQAKSAPAGFLPFLKVIQTFNKRKLRYYPGSPQVVANLRRSSDRLLLCETQADTFQALKQCFARTPNVVIQQTDGYMAINSFLPPKERRGCVLIDPPFESSQDFNNCVHAITKALKVWQTGTYMVWYPILEKSLVNRFYRQLRALTTELPCLCIEFSQTKNPLPTVFQSAGMVIINPPYQLHTQLKELLPWLAAQLSTDGVGSYSVAHWNA